MTPAPEALHALKSAASWLERWASHVGTCAGGMACTCGLTAIRAETEAAITAYHAALPEVEVDGLLLLRVADTKPPIYIIRERNLAEGYTDELYEHLFESNMCPHDVIGCEVVIEGDDIDPHGVFEFVQMVPKPADWPFVGEVTFARYAALFDRLRDDVAARNAIGDEQ